MTDLETACRELVAELRKEGDVLTHKNQYRYERAKGKAMHRTADRLESVVEEHTEVPPEVKTLVAQMEDAT